MLAGSEPICVSYVHTDEGQIVFDRPVIPADRLRRSTRRPELDAVIRLASAASLAVMLAGCTAHEQESTWTPEPAVYSEAEPDSEPQPCEPMLAEDDDEHNPPHKRRPAEQSMRLYRTAGAPH